MATKRIQELTSAVTAPTAGDWIAIDNASGGSTNKITVENMALFVLDDAEIGGTGATDIVVSNATQTLTNKLMSNPKINSSTEMEATSAELDVLHGATATTAEINLLAGLTATAADLERLAEVNSALMGKDENQAVNDTNVTGSLNITTGSGNYVFRTEFAAINATMPEISTKKSEEIMCIFGTDGGYNVNILRFAGDAGFIMADGTTTGTLITMADVGDFVYLKSSSIVNGYWMILGGTGYVLSA